MKTGTAECKKYIENCFNCFHRGKYDKKECAAYCPELNRWIRDDEIIEKDSMGEPICGFPDTCPLEIEEE